MEHPFIVQGSLEEHWANKAEKKRQFIESDIAALSPVPSEFAQGDIISYTNDYGVEVKEVTILGFVPEVDPHFRPEALIYLDWDCYWSAVPPESITFVRRDDHLALSPEQLEAFWNQFSDVPVDEDGHLEVSWRHFPVNTHREEVWSWFEDQHPRISVAALMGLIDA